MPDLQLRQDTHGNGILYNEPRAAVETVVSTARLDPETGHAHHLGYAAGEGVKEENGKWSFEKGPVAAGGTQKPSEVFEEQSLRARREKNKMALFERVPPMGRRSSSAKTSCKEGRLSFRTRWSSPAVVARSANHRHDHPASPIQLENTTRKTIASKSRAWRSLGRARSERRGRRQARASRQQDDLFDLPLLLDDEMLWLSPLD